MAHVAAMIPALASLALLAAPAPPACTGETAFLWDDVRVWLPARVEGRPVELVLDTGAASAVLDKPVADALGLPATAVGAATGAGPGSTRQWRLGPATAQVAGLALPLPSPLALALTPLLAEVSGHRFDGILGAPLFAACRVTLDFDAGRLTLAPPGGPAPAGAMAIPLTLVDGVPLAPITLELPGGRAIRLTALIDLGAKATLLVSEDAIARHRIATPGAVEARLGAGVGGVTRFAWSRARALHLGPATMPGPIIGLSVGGSLRGDYEALLGAGFLHRFEATFDYAARTLWLKPRAAPGPDTFDASGLYLLARDGVTVAEVRPGSPAARAGLAPGDRILTTLTLGQLRAALAPATSATVTLRWRNAAGEHAAALALTPAFSEPSLPASRPAFPAPSP